MEESNRSEGVVKEWRADDVWGVIEIPSLVGGCFAHFSNIEAPGNAYRELHPGDRVDVVWEYGEQDGYPARAINVKVIP